jgi:endonuclease YncB( thermonuclease family)
MAESAPSVGRWLVAIALAGVVISVPTYLFARAPAPHGQISGEARVIDGDTIVIDGTHIRLEGIDAPELSQSCNGASGQWACGRTAMRALTGLIGSGSVTCESRGLDKYGRVLGTCFIGNRDINAEMVRQGNAWAFVKYSRSYVSAEKEARTAHRGVWQGETEPAWDYRHKRWASAEPEAPNGCAIKGNISGNGHIYHMPWSAWYGKVQIDPARGERWFCSEAEAQAAGWRPVMTH